MVTVLLRHLLSIALLPVTMAGVIPWWLARRNHLSFGLGRTPLELTAQLTGLAALAAGLVLFVASVRQFALRGRGTLAPWDPPRRLVIDGPYRYVRNPMIAGVAFVLAGEALLLLSPAHAAWAAVFVAVNAFYIPLLEEPDLEARFGADYRNYRRHVRMILPRLRPWQG